MLSQSIPSKKGWFRKSSIPFWPNLCSILQHSLWDKQNTGEFKFNANPFLLLAIDITFNLNDWNFQTNLCIKSLALFDTSTSEGKLNLPWKETTYIQHPNSLAPNFTPNSLTTVKESLPQSKLLVLGLHMLRMVKLLLSVTAIKPNWQRFHFRLQFQWIFYQWKNPWKRHLPISEFIPLIDKF